MAEQVLKADFRPQRAEADSESDADHRYPQSSIFSPQASSPLSPIRCLDRGNVDLVDQLKRALSSAILNATEGNGRTSIKERARFFDIAIASAAEAASAIEVMVAFGAIRKNDAIVMSENIRIGYAMLINLKKATAGLRAPLP